MAISQKKYVDITSRFPVNESVERILGGLVFTKAQMNESSDEGLLEKKRAYDAGELVVVDAADAATLFNKSGQGVSAETDFATKYYGYASPNGYVPSALKFARVMSTNVPVYQKGVAYAADAYFEYHGSVYKVGGTGVSAEANTYFKGVSGRFSSAIDAYSSESSSGYAIDSYFKNTTGSGTEAVTSVYRAIKAIASGTAFSSLKLGEDMVQVAYTAYAACVGYSSGDVVSYESSGTTNYYACVTKVAAFDNDGWADNANITATEQTTLPTIVYETASVALTRVDKSDNSFGSFTFLDSKDASGTALAFTDAEVKDATTTNNGFGSRYLASVSREKGTQSATAMVTKKTNCVGDGSKGVAFVQGSTGTVSAYIPMTIFAATDYDNGAEVPCQMYKQFGSEEPTVFNDEDYTKLSENYINFYGQSQSNGKRINFYQRGFNTDGTDTSIYCNEVWFKSRCLTRLMNLFLSKERVPANNEGLAMVSYEVGEVCNAATRCGAFMAKDVSDSNALNIRTIVVQKGGTTALADEIIKGVVNVGFYVWTYLYQDANEYKIGYYVFYGTADSVRFIKGDDLLVK